MKVSGTVKDAATGQPLQFANVFWSEKDGRPDPKNWGRTTNARGRYDFGSDVGSLNLTASFVGYETQTKKLPLEDANVIINFDLKPKASNLPGITVVGTRLPRPPQWRQKLIIGTVIVLFIYGIYRFTKPRFAL